MTNLVRTLLLPVSWAICFVPYVAHAACNHEQHAPWTATGAAALSINAYYLGASCGAGAVVLTVSDKAGAVLLTLSRPAQHVSIFSGEGLNTADAIKAELKNWIEIGNDNAMDTSSLPDWPQGAEAPARESEFGFFPDQFMNREYYLEQRAAKRPLFCTVTGMESETCIIFLDDGRVSEFGGMTFPG